ncbi:HsdM family class I SAM-dependent methyltransferase [Sphingomonas sp.]|uniref:HsdM family class I SAM-dependent methyltransferase n=1 Tax=Sphingomonas sp. TaxID=28214 RepID=UPI003BA9A8B8
MSSLVRPSTKDLGAYYTPDAIADVLAAWVVQTGRERLLEPSIGNGALLRASLAAGQKNLTGAKHLRFVGCDLDNDAISGVRDWLPDEHTLLLGDFLDFDPSNLGSFDGVISNPPFTRNHALPKVRRDELRRRFAIKGAAGLWVAFLLHSIRFLANGGRLAAVVPAASIFTTYGRDAIDRICGQFSYVEIRKIVDKPLWSSHAEERGVIVLAKGYRWGSCQRPETSRWLASGDRVADVYHSNPACFRDALEESVPLGSLATLSIGAVTGANKTFLLTEEERVAAEIATEDLRLVAARSRHITGLQISTDQLRDLALAGEKTWLLTPRDISKERAGVRARLATIPAEKRRTVVWLNKRSPWWAVDIGSGCDAIFTYMNDRGPRIVLADEGVLCTNTLHQMRFGPKTTLTQRMIVSLSMISSFGQLAAERVGRAYGGGLLKFELTDARRLPVLVGARSGTKSAFARANAAMEAGDAELARNIADAHLLPSVFGVSWKNAAAQMMVEALQMRSARRVGGGA